MNSVGVFGRGFDFDCLFGEESRFAAKSSISSMIVLTSKCDVFLDSFLLASIPATPFTWFLFKFWLLSLLLLSSFLAPSPPWLSSSPVSSIGQKVCPDLELSARGPGLLSESSFTVVRELFCDTCNIKQFSRLTAWCSISHEPSWWRRGTSASARPPRRRRPGASVRGWCWGWCSPSAAWRARRSWWSGPPRCSCSCWTVSRSGCHPPEACARSESYVRPPARCAPSRNSSWGCQRAVTRSLLQWQLSPPAGRLRTALTRRRLSGATGPALSLASPDSWAAPSCRTAGRSCWGTARSSSAAWSRPRHSSLRETSVRQTAVRRLTHLLCPAVCAAAPASPAGSSCPSWRPATARKIYSQCPARTDSLHCKYWMVSQINSTPWAESSQLTTSKYVLL